LSKCQQEAALDIYLIQHAESVPEKEDPARPLSDEGKATMEKVAALVARLKIKPDFIFHSEKLRAKQTAEILARNLGLSDKLRERKGLGPLDPAAPVAGWLKEETAKGLAGLAIVGHLPFLDRLASLLITENESLGVVSFQNGAIVKLVPRPDRARYMVQLVITKQLAEQAETGAR
jgi:phosphohistidine phosphatase